MICAAFTRPSGNRIERIMDFHVGPVSFFIRIGCCKLTTSLEIGSFSFVLQSRVACTLCVHGSIQVIEIHDIQTELR